MATHDITWTKPAPFWSDTTEGAADSDDPQEFQRPGLLRFATDTFMEDFIDLLATDPKRLGEYRARPETWRSFIPAPPPVQRAKAHALPFQRLGFARRNVTNGRPAVATRPPADALPPSTDPTPPPAPPLKLYQPAHQRYYLVSSCLVCRTPGLPDRKVDTAHQQRVGFVLRRLFANEPGVEHAWVKAPGKAFAWTALTNEQKETLVENEDLLPMFAMNFTTDDLRRRRLFAGLVPAGKREVYLGAPKAPPQNAAPAGSDKTARKILFRAEVAEPWKALITLASKVATDNPDPTGSDLAEKREERRKVIKATREQIQTGSWLILNDLLGYLKTYLPNVYKNVVQAPDAAAPTGNEPQLLALLASLAPQPQLWNALRTLYPAAALPATPRTLREILRLMKPLADANALDQIDRSFDLGDAATPWPVTLLFPLADPEFPSAAPIPTAAPSPAESDAIGAEPTTPPVDAVPDPAKVDLLTAKIILALDPAATTPAPAVPPSAIAPADSMTGRFVIRCIYERPTCGPLHKDVVSPPSEEFLLAGFFDPDAPARPIRIGLPIDTTPAGLRKFDKNTAFVMSDILCGQIKRMKGITFGDLVMSILPWPFHRDISAPDKGPCAGGMGTICSLSIPIITLCALILLMIIVALLDFVFKWVPFLIMCFPLPKLKAKSP